MCVLDVNGTKQLLIVNGIISVGCDATCSCLIAESISVLFVCLYIHFTAHQQGQTWSPPENKCEHYTCIKSGETLTITHVVCLPFQQSSCVPVSITYSEINKYRSKVGIGVKIMRKDLLWCSVVHLDCISLLLNMLLCSSTQSWRGWEVWCTCSGVWAASFSLTPVILLVDRKE